MLLACPRIWGIVQFQIPMGWRYYIVGVGVRCYVQLLAVLCMFSGIITSYLIYVKRYKRFVKLAVVDDFCPPKPCLGSASETFHMGNSKNMAISLS